LLRDIYAVAKPLLGLILLNENQFFTEIKQQLLYGHAQVKQTNLSIALDNLMIGIDRTLTERNKENFIQNLIQFRNEIQDSLRNADDHLLLSSSISSSTGSSIRIPMNNISISNQLPLSSYMTSLEELMTQ
jgi:hypothetical protein